MSRLMLPLLALLLPACVSVRTDERVSLDATGVRAVSARVDRGDVRIFGARGATDFDVTATVYGNGSRRVRAEQRQATVGWAAQVDGFSLILDGNTVEGRSGVDFRVNGPEVLDLDIVAEGGTVQIDQIEGIHLITASQVTGRAIGDLDVFGRTGVDLDFVPYTETDARIESNGGVTLALPFGLPYDLTVRSDPNDSMEVAELGWDDLVLGEGFVSGLRGRGDIEIDILADGPVRIVELR